MSFGLPHPLPETLTVAPDGVLVAARMLKSLHGFDLLLDLTAVDWLGRRQPRFEVVWHLYATGPRQRIRMKTAVTEEAARVDSLTPLYGSALFLERECREMYGIAFEGLADTRPILLYEGFEGHPLRKDYPIAREQPLVPYRK